MEIPYSKLAWACQVLILWLPMVLATCEDDLKLLPLGNIQKFPHMLESIRDSCASLLRRDSNECSADCNAKAQEMVDMYDGSHIFFTCNCSKSVPIHPVSECWNVQERLAVCPSLVTAEPTQPTTVSTVARIKTTRSSTTPTILEDGKVPCASARQRCQRSTDCVSQKQTTISTCEGPGCDKACQRELDTLFVLQAAQDLWQCTNCDDDKEGGWCDLVKRCTAVQAQDDTGGGRAQKSVKPLGNAARPLYQFLISPLELLIITAALRITFF